MNSHQRRTKKRKGLSAVRKEVIKNEMERFRSTGTANTNTITTTAVGTITVSGQDGFYTNNYESWEVRNGKIIK